MTLDTFEDDDLAAVKSPTTTPGQPKTNQRTKVAARQDAPVPPASSTDDISFGSDEADEMAKAAEGLPTVKISKTEAARFAFVPGQPLKHGKVHYREGFGSYKCLSIKDGVKQLCCKADGDPTHCAAPSPKACEILCRLRRRLRDHEGLGGILPCVQAEAQ